MRILVNHLGYDPDGRKRAVLRTSGEEPSNVRIVDDETNAVVCEPKPTREGPVANWKDWVFWTVEFTSVEAPGRYYVAADAGGRTARSEPFEIREDIVREETLSDVLFHFKSQRCSGTAERADRAVPFVGDREDRVDVRGGWYDASGDESKYLSHLSYANYVNPQQTPIVVWGLLDAREQLHERADALGDQLDDRLVEESLHGADFLVRMQDEAGYFYMTIFDQWSHDPDRREVCAFEGFDGRKTDDYEAGYRQGGGVAIAALARAGTIPGPSEYDADEYLSAAIDGFDHLEANNEAYLDDGTENVIDDYCALLAATELYAATGTDRFRRAATERARSLLDRQTDDDRYAGWWRADADGDRPFYHAAEEGFPALALCRHLAVLDESPIENDVRSALTDYWEFELGITDEVTNPFGYARGYAKPVGADDPRATFFLPHDNETGYWWQGENARIASLAAAAERSRAHVDGLDDELAAFARSQLDWILGLNPFDASMMQEIGRGAPEYHRQHRNAPGGIVNGITAGVDDESDIAFLPDGYADDHDYRWRWAEQWLPHAAWFVVAASSRGD